MPDYLKKHPIGLVSIIILLVYLSLYWFIENSVYRTLRYKASYDEITLNRYLRNLSGKLLLMDSIYQVYLNGLQDSHPNPNVVLLNIDHNLIAEQNTWPLARRVHAEILNKLADMQPKAVMVDIIFEWPQTPWVLETLGNHVSEIPPQTYRSLVSDLNFDGQLKKALSRLNYTLITVPTFGNQQLTEQQHNLYAQNLARLVRTTQVSVSGEGETSIFPYQRLGGIRTSILPLQLRAKGQGNPWYNPDRYNAIGSAPLLHRLETISDPPKSYYLMHIAAETVRIYEGEKGYSLKLRDGRADELIIGNHIIKTDPAGEMQVNFYGRYNKGESVIPVIAARDLLDGKVDPAALRDKLVVFGTDTDLLHDYHITPVGELWGTELSAYAISNILNGDYYYKPIWSAWLEIPLLILLFLLTMFAVIRMKPVRSLLVAIGLAAAVIVVIGLLFIYQNMSFSITYPVGLIAIIYLQATTMRFVIDERQKRLYKNALGLYLSPELTNQVADNPALLSLDGKEQELTVLFSDIRDFTRISETMQAEQLTSFLQQYLSPMTDIVFDTDGTLDKYIGDAVMAFWGAPLEQPDHARRACEAAFQMLERLDLLREIWRQQGLPPIQIGIGINSGLMRVGNMGSDRRLSYTVMGDNVNLGSRLEGLTKYYGVPLIVSDNTWQQVCGAFHGRELDRVAVKGREQAVPVHELIGRGEPGGERRTQLEAWHAALSAYRRRDWDNAEPVFREWSEQYQDKAARMYLAQIATYRLNPPEADWQAVNSMSVK